jgi:hypothetical protein
LIQRLGGVLTFVMPANFRRIDERARAMSGVPVQRIT